MRLGHDSINHGGDGLESNGAAETSYYYEWRIGTRYGDASQFTNSRFVIHRPNRAAVRTIGLILVRRGVATPHGWPPADVTYIGRCVGEMDGTGMLGACSFSSRL